MYWLLCGVSAVLTGLVVVLLPDDGEPVPTHLGMSLAGAIDRTRPVTAADLRRVDLPLTRRGYDPGAVDALLERVARQIEGRGPVRATIAPSGPIADPTMGSGVGSGEELEERRRDLPGGLDG